MKKLIVTAMLSVTGGIFAATQETVNDFAPLTAAEFPSTWSVASHTHAVVSVATSDAFDLAEVLPTVSASAAVDTRVADEASAFLEILSTISPGFFILVH